MPIGRRFLLAAAAATMGGQVAASTPDWPRLAARWISSMQTAMAAFDGPGLIRSFVVREDTDAEDFDRVHGNCAYVYDNALAGLALLAAGDRPAAARIAAALADAQANDRFWHDGRLRNAYAAGPSARPVKLPGWWDAGRNAWLEDGYQVGSATGVIAWAILLWTALGAEFRAAAEAAAAWIATATRGAQGFTGGLIGHEPAPQAMTWTSTEQNLDCEVAFRRLQRRADADFAAAFVAQMWDKGERRFLSGLTPDGAPNRHSAIDANLWPGLADQASHDTAIDWVLARHALPVENPAGQKDGVDFDTDRDGIWLEGTAITALTLRRAGADQLALRFAGTLEANTAPQGMIFACTPQRLTTGLTTGLDSSAPAFVYYRRPHLAATAWAALAAMKANPLA